MRDVMWKIGFKFGVACRREGKSPGIEGRSEGCAQDAGAPQKSEGRKSPRVAGAARGGGGEVKTRRGWTLSGGCWTSVADRTQERKRGAKRVQCRSRGYLPKGKLRTRGGGRLSARSKGLLIVHPRPALVFLIPSRSLILPMSTCMVSYSPFLTRFSAPTRARIRARGYVGVHTYKGSFGLADSSLVEFILFGRAGFSLEDQSPNRFPLSLLFVRPTDRTRQRRVFAVAEMRRILGVSSNRCTDSLSFDINFWVWLGGC